MKKKKLVAESLNEREKPMQSRGKTQKILDFIEEAGPEGRRYTDIIKFAYELTHGEGSYTRENRGYWSGGFKTPTPDDRGFGHLMKYITKNEEGRWILRDSRMSGEEAEKLGRSADYRNHTGFPRKVGRGGKFNL